MNAKMIQFLLIAVVVMALCLGVGGGWLLPRFGIEGMLAQAIPGAIGGAIVALLYQRMIMRSDGA